MNRVGKMDCGMIIAAVSGIADRIYSLDCIGADTVAVVPPSVAIRVVTAIATLAAVRAVIPVATPVVDVAIGVHTRIMVVILAIRTKRLV
jgi:hypothetical protein